MSTIEQFLEHLSSLDVKVRLQDGRLQVDAPKGVIDGDLRESLLARKAELLEYLEGNGHASKLSPPLNIPTVSREQLLPLSFSQERFWLLDKLFPGNPAYNIPFAYYIKGELNASALEQSIRTIMQRHESLRTNFTIADGHAVQVINDEVRFTLPVCECDIQHLPESEQNARIMQLATENAQISFDLERDSLVRGKLVRLGHERYLFLMSTHHIVSDGWSCKLIFSELAELYRSLCTGTPASLPELTIQYADFAVWQRQWLQGDILKTQLNYWKKKLSGASHVLDLPTDFTRPAVVTSRGGRHFFQYTLRLTDELKDLARQENCTLFMVLLAAYSVVMHRYTGQEDIIIGSPIAGRNQIQIEPLIGYFSNTMALRTNFTGNPTFRELLARVLETTLGAYEHQDMPFEKLIEEFQSDRTLDRGALVQVMLALQDTTYEDFALPGLEAIPLEYPTGVVKVDVETGMWDTPAGLWGIIDYSSDLFSPATIERLAEHLHCLLEAVAADPDRRVSDLPLLPEAEQRKMLLEWNDTDLEYPKDKCVHDLVEEQAARTPDAAAVLFGDEELSYRQLSSASNQLARRLQSLGVGPGSLVGICMERSHEMLVGLLGVLKSGGAYVPLDPTHPKERLAMVIEDAGISVMLTQSNLVSTLPEHNARVVCLDSDWEAISSLDDTMPPTSTDSRSLAYVIYTSGSTGRPKGVQISHRSVVNLLCSLSDKLRLSGSDVLVAVTTIAFDISVLELFAPLITGGKVVVAGREVCADGARLISLLRSCAATIMQATPATWHLLRASGWTGEPGIRVLCGGESLQNELARWLVGVSDEVWNVYGPTETTIWSTMQRVDADALSEGIQHWVSIGRPIGNTKVYVLDAHRRPVPIGVPGELYIGGDGVARGYLNRPDLDSEKFVPNPFGGSADDRLYRTGDLVRFMQDGSLEFMGRLDFQVKLRGFRIELGEIETALLRHSCISAAAVIIRDDTGDKRLVAYIVADPESTPSASDLRAFLKDKLPDYMLPSAFVVLEELPLTPNGKVDRKALPSVSDVQNEPNQHYTSPRTPMEEVLVGMWTELLGIERVGVHDDFFAHGGHSLLATQLTSRVRDVLGVELTLREVFEAPTPAELAECIAKLSDSKDNLQAPAIVPVDRNSLLPLSFAQQRLWFLDQMEPGQSVYNIAMALRLTGALEVPALEQALNEIVRRHESLRTTFGISDGQPFQIITDKLILPLDVMGLEELPQREREDEVQRLAVEEAHRPFDLAFGPLLRAKLLRLSETEHVLLLTMHHIVSDAWSVGILGREISTLYRVFSRGNEPLPPGLPIQYADFAVWQRQWLQGDVLERRLAYWTRQLDGAPGMFTLSSDYPRPLVQTFQGSFEKVTIPTRLADELKELGRRESATLYMVLLSAFKVLLRAYTGENDIVVGSPIANRDHAQIEGLIGFFVNTLVLRTTISDDPTFKQLLHKVRETSLAAYAHQDLPFEQLVEAMQPTRDLGRTPLFQIFFNMLNVPDMHAGESDLQIERVDYWGEAESKFDITLYSIETAEGIELSLLYNSVLFASQRMRAMLNHFLHLLGAIAADPGMCVSALPLLSDEERRRSCVQPEPVFSDVTFEEFKPRDIEQSIPDRFARQVNRHPNKVAVKTDAREWTYQQLSDITGRTASALLAQCGADQVRVVLLFEQDAPMIAGMLGALRAGMAYVPLDPSYPDQRLAYQIQDSQARVLLTDSANLALARRLAPEGLIVINVEELDALAPFDETLPAVSPDSLAYILYTSGSTGVPKGVMQSHRNVLHFIRVYTNNLHVSSDDRLTLLSSYTFDAAVIDIYSALLNGATLYPKSARESKPEELSNWLVKEQITLYHSTPTAFRHLIGASADGRLLTDIRAVVLGGEEVRGQDLELHSQRFGEGCALVNLFGSSESSISLLHVIDNPAHRNGSFVSIGYPVEETRITLLDADGRESEVFGEMVVSSPYVALGYAGKPELTASAFVTDAVGNARAYKTGDLARLEPDGSLRFMGRRDWQRKIRGFRVEMGEVEAALLSYEQVSECAAIVDETGEGLVGFIVSNDSISLLSLRSHIRKQLPDYMIPSSFVKLDELPRTPNGKIDTGKLKSLGKTTSVAGAHYRAPVSATEKTVAEIWRNVLKVDKVGLDDTFFNLGGHSLLAVKAISDMEKLLDSGVRLRDMFTLSLRQIAAGCTSKPG